MSDIKEQLETLLRSPASELRWEEPMAGHTTFRAGGRAMAFASPGSEQELRELTAFCRCRSLPYVIVGNGSNLLVSDKGYQGVVVSLAKMGAWLRREGNCITAGAGERLSRVSRLALEASLTGFEFAAGIPGTVGGALTMNAGAYGSEMKDVLTRARVMTPEGELRELTAQELQLGYRSSCIPAKEYIVLEAEFGLCPGERERIGERMQELSRKRREKQPLEYPSAGSTFKRPEGNFAGRLIEEAGLRGFSVGGAQVSEKHCGFVINRGNATASEIYELCRQVRARVRSHSGVELELEVRLLGDF